MFCTNLRRRASFASVLPQLISTEGLKLRENRLEAHDLAIPLPTTFNPNGQPDAISVRDLRVLLLSPTSTTAANMPQTLDRIHHFAGLTGGQDLIVVFLLSSTTGAETSTSNSVGPIPPANINENTVHPTLAFTQLQVSLLPRTDIPYIPILPLSNLSNLPSLLQKHASALSHRHHQPPIISNTTPKSLELLQLATTEPPMDRETLFFVTDCFENLREFAMACSEPEVDLQGFLGDLDAFEGLRYESGKGRDATERLRKLRDLVGGEKFREITDFWADEWVFE